MPPRVKCHGLEFPLSDDLLPLGKKDRILCELVVMRSAGFELTPRSGSLGGIDYTTLRCSARSCPLSLSSGLARGLILANRWRSGVCDIEGEALGGSTWFAMRVCFVSVVVRGLTMSQRAKAAPQTAWDLELRQREAERHS